MSSSAIIDLIIVGIVVLTTLIAAKRGFVRTLVEVVGFVLAAVLSVNLGSAAAGLAYDNVISPKLVAVAEDAADTTTNNMLDAAWEGLPDFIVENAEKFGISKEKINESVSQIGGEDRAAAIGQAIDASIRPVFVRVIGMLCSALIFVVLSFVVKLLAKLLNGVFSFSIAGKLNRTLGGIIGLIEGSVFAVIFCIVVGMIVSFTGGFWIFTEAGLSASFIAKFLLSITPFAI